MRRRYTAPVLPDPAATVIDLRDDAQRAATPLTGLPNRVLPVTLGAIEDGDHTLTPGMGPLVVVCERGLRSTLAARLLRADDLDARAYEGGVPALLRALNL